jgi:uncharacterized protein (TIGR02466 family)
MSVNLLFSTPIYDSFEQDEELDKEIDVVFEKIKKENCLSNPWQDGVKTSFKYESANDIEKYGMTKFRDVVLKHTMAYASIMEMKPGLNFEIKDSWLNVYDYKDYQHFHTHPNADISFVYYHKAPENSGNLMFEAPDLAHQMSNFLVNCGHFNVQQRVGIKPSKGKIVMFPAFLRHAVMQNETNETRVSLAVNIKIR